MVEDDRKRVWKMVVIKKMSMPKNCRACPFKSETYWHGREICLANDKKEIVMALDTGRDDECPLYEANEAQQT